MLAFTRRRFLATASAVGLGAAEVLPNPLTVSSGWAAEPSPPVLRAVDRVIEVNGRAAKVFGLQQPNGTSGMVLPAGRFRVRLENRLSHPTLIHWHGLTPPYGQDGVPDLPQPLLPSGQSYDYDFPLRTAGTHWMHAHTLQEQQLLAAPLIVVDPEEAGFDEQSVVVLLHDFSFKPPEELLAELSGSATPHAGKQTSGQSAVLHAGHGAGAMAMDVNDIEYDAYLANDRTLDDPEVVRTEVGGKVRLRLINGATATGFWIDLGALEGEVIAVDGHPVVPVRAQRFPLGMGQRIDIRIQLPSAQGAWPILALRAGAGERTGFVLATSKGAVGRIATSGAAPLPPLDLTLESRLRAAQPLAEKAANRHDTMILGGGMAPYVWTFDGLTWDQRRSLRVRSGQRVELTLRNDSHMDHPIHLHGHELQVVAVDGKPIAGAIRDTVWLPIKRAVTVAFDANNPGPHWALHCHHLYHMATGMMTTVEYEL